MLNNKTYKILRVVRPTIIQPLPKHWWKQCKKLFCIIHYKGEKNSRASTIRSRRKDSKRGSWL